MANLFYILINLYMKYYSLFIYFNSKVYSNAVCLLNWRILKKKLGNCVLSLSILESIINFFFTIYSNYEIKLIYFLNLCVKNSAEIYLSIVILIFCLIIFLNLIYINKEKKYKITLVSFVVSYSIFLNFFYLIINIYNIYIISWFSNYKNNIILNNESSLFADFKNGYIFTSFTEFNFLSISDYILQSILAFSFIIWLVAYLSFIKNKYTLGVYGNSEIVIIYLLVSYLLYKLISSDNLITFVLLLESQNLALCIICAYGIGNYLSKIEAALKLYITSAASTGFLLLGCGLMYGSTGSIYFNDFKMIMDQRYIEEFLRVIEKIIIDLINNGVITDNTWAVYNFYINENNEVNIYLFVVGTLCFFICFAFKLGQVPFHLWISDVYSGGSVLFISFLAIFPKIAIGYFFVKVVSLYFCKDMLLLILLFVSGIVTIVVGMLGAMARQKIKSFIAYSSIANIGYLILLSSLAYLLNADIIIILSLIFFISYILVILQIFIVIFTHHYIINQVEPVKEVEFLSEFSGLYKHNKINAIFLSVGFLALIGIPPILGFIIKFYISSVILFNGLYYVGLIFLILGVISTIYYLKIIKIIIFDKMNKNLHLINNSVNNKISQFFIFASQVLIFLKPLIIMIIIFIMLF